jgi:hypothetical protein
VSSNPQLEALLAMVKDLPASDLPRFLGDLEEIRIAAQMRISPMPAQAQSTPTEFFSVYDIATRWRCSRGTVYNRLRSAGAIALDFTSKKQSRSKRSIPRSVVMQIEAKHTKHVF